MPDGAAAAGRELTATVVLLIAAAAALAGAGALGWAWVDLHVPKRGIIEVRVAGSELLPVLAPLAVLALAAVAAVLATGGWARRLLGGLLLVAAAPPVLGVLKMGDDGWLIAAGFSAAGWSTGSVDAGMVTMVPSGPAFAAAGAVLLVAAGVALVVRGHRMPRLGHRYRAPTVRVARPPEDSLDGLWARMDAGEDPTASGHPR